MHNTVVFVDYDDRTGGETGQQRFSDIKKPSRVQSLIHAQMETNTTRMFGGAGGGNDVATQLEKLEGMLERGTLTADEFMRRFLLHGLPTGFHRIRHYGLLANAGRREHLAQVRRALDAPAPEPIRAEADKTPAPTFVCRCCGAALRIVEVFPRWPTIRAPP